MNKKEFTVPPEAAGLRLDYYLAQHLADEFSRTKIKQLIEQEKILLNRQATVPHTHLKSGDQLSLEYAPESESGTRAENIPIDVVYDDEAIIVVNKPAGMVVHPACGNPNGTLVNALLHYTKSLSSLGDVTRPGIVHRLDKDTSGLMVVAKNDIAHRFLAKQFDRHEIERVYWVVVNGAVQHDEMRSRESLGRSSMNRKKVVVKEDGKTAVTNFRVLKRFAKATLLEARPETGRTHQIRVHLKALGYPVLGDDTYGMHSEFISRQALHAKTLGFTHPQSKKKVSFDSELPADMKYLLDALGNIPFPSSS